MTCFPLWVVDNDGRLPWEALYGYQLYLRSRGKLAHRQHFSADDDGTAVAVAGAVFHDTAEHWDSYDLWDGARLVGGPIAENCTGSPIASSE